MIIRIAVIIALATSVIGCRDAVTSPAPIWKTIADRGE
jgi:hypothetical protein